MNISVVIPALNEETTLPAWSNCLGGGNEVIVINSDSTDATAVRAHAAGARVIVLPLPPIPWQERSFVARRRCSDRRRGGFS